MSIVTRDTMKIIKLIDQNLQKSHYVLNADVLQESLTSMRSVTQDDTVKPEVKYPRDPGYRPPPEENPYNAW